MDSKKIYLFLGIIITIVVVGLLILFYTGGQKPDQTKSKEDGEVAGATTQDSIEDQAWIEGLAKSLTEKGMVMYGAYWCSHCNNQKKMFGDAEKYIDYVECDPSGEGANPDECKANEIDGYPTWIYEGTKYPGEMSLEKLAQIIGYK